MKLLHLNRLYSYITYIESGIKGAGGGGGEGVGKTVKV